MSRTKSTTELLLVGDCMLGRLLDQLSPFHNYSPRENYACRTILFENKQKLKEFENKGFSKYIWGSTLELFQVADGRIINLETSITTVDKKWPNQAFNFRMHPKNVSCLKEAKVDFCSLANNHILDFGVKGMKETCESLDKIGIKHSGCGLNLKEASKPSYFQMKEVKVACFAASDHFDYWKAGESTPGIHFLDPKSYSRAHLENLREEVMRAKGENGANLAVMSIHWGPNYSWNPSEEIQNLAHDLVDKCGFDLIHGTSSHHIQGIEIYKKCPILYGCGDFVDDYAVEQNFRNDLGFAYKLYFSPSEKQFVSIKMVPTVINTFQVSTSVTQNDKRWLYDRMTMLCQVFETEVKCTTDDKELEILI